MPRRERTPVWKEYLSQIQANVELRKAEPDWPDGFELLYAVDPPSSRATGAIVLDLYSRSRKKSGDPTVWKEFRIAHTRAGHLPDAMDADLVPMMLGGTDTFSFNYSSAYGTSTRKALPLRACDEGAAAGGGRGPAGVARRTTRHSFRRWSGTTANLGACCWRSARTIATSGPSRGRSRAAKSACNSPSPR